MPVFYGKNIPRVRMSNHRQFENHVLQPSSGQQRKRIKRRIVLKQPTETTNAEWQYFSPTMFRTRNFGDVEHLQGSKVVGQSARTPNGVARPTDDCVARPPKPNLLYSFPTHRARRDEDLVIRFIVVSSRSRPE